MLSGVMSETGEPRKGLFLRDDLEEADVVRAHREALRVLRDSIETAHFDAYSDEPWPQDVVAAYEYALSMAERDVAGGARRPKGDFRMGIDVDVRDDTQFEVLLALAPFTIHAEGRRGSEEIFSASDTGTALWIAVSAEQEALLMSLLAAQGVPDTVFTGRPRKRPGLLVRWSRRRSA